MGRLWAIAAREYGSFFRVPLGWVVIALFLFLSGLVFSFRMLNPGEPASMREFFATWWSLLIVIAPAISMRLLSEELRAGTVEPLLTSPVSELAVVAGKYLAAVGFLVTALLPTLAYVWLLSMLARPDLGPVLAGYLGILLLGMLYLAVGTLLSTLTSSQTLAFLSTLFVLVAIEFVLTAVEAVAAQMGVTIKPPWDQLLLGLSANARLGDFAKGVIDTSHVVFFLAASLWFVVMAAVVLRMRRWR